MYDNLFKFNYFYIKFVNLIILFLLVFYLDDYFNTLLFNTVECMEVESENNTVNKELNEFIKKTVEKEFKNQTNNLFIKVSIGCAILTGIAFGGAYLYKVFSK